eukprot:15187361-Alexandrium_andersonii.AAC.1
MPLFAAKAEAALGVLSGSARLGKRTANKGVCACVRMRISTPAPDSDFAGWPTPRALPNRIRDERAEGSFKGGLMARVRRARGV